MKKIKLLKPTEQALIDFKFTSPPPFIPLCEKHAYYGTDVIINKEIDISVLSCGACIVEKYSNKYPRIAYCPDKEPIRYKNNKEIWLTGSKIYLVPYSHIDLYIYDPYYFRENEQNKNNYEYSGKRGQYLYYRMVSLDNWILKLDSTEPPNILNYYLVWPPTDKKNNNYNGPIKSLIGYRPIMPTYYLKETANERIRR